MRDPCVRILDSSPESELYFYIYLIRDEITHNICAQNSMVSRMLMSMGFEDFVSINREQLLEAYEHLGSLQITLRNLKENRHNAKLSLLKLKVCASSGCDKMGYKICSGCEMEYYCSRRCQKRSWNKEHRFVCKKLCDFYTFK